MKKVNIIREACIGCGSCEAIAPNIFKLDEEGISIVLENMDNFEKLNAEDKEVVNECIEVCPTCAITKEEKDS